MILTLLVKVKNEKNPVLISDIQHFVDEYYTGLLFATIFSSTCQVCL